MTLNLTPADLARLRTRFAAMSAAVAPLGPAFREAKEVGERVLREDLAKIGRVLDAAKAEQTEAFRRLGERMGEVMKNATAEIDLTAELPADVAATPWPTADAE